MPIENNSEEPAEKRGVRVSGQDTAENLNQQYFDGVSSADDTLDNVRALARTELAKEAAQKGDLD